MQATISQEEWEEYLELKKNKVESFKAAEIKVLSGLIESLSRYEARFQRTDDVVAIMKQTRDRLMETK